MLKANPLPEVGELFRWYLLHVVTTSTKGYANLEHYSTFSYDTSATMTKFLLTAAALVASANAFAPASKTTTSSSTSLNEFVRGYVGGEGPEPMPFSSQQSSVNWDPFDLSGVSGGFTQ